MIILLGSIYLRVGSIITNKALIIIKGYIIIKTIKPFIIDNF